MNEKKFVTTQKNENRMESNAFKKVSIKILKKESITNRNLIWQIIFSRTYIS